MKADGLSMEIDAKAIQEVLRAERTQHGESLADVTDRYPVLLVFLRHLG
jgi:hypothetical protein